MSDSLSNNKISYFSKECFDCLKGYFALFVLTHHIFLFTGILLGTKFEIILYNLGYWSVSIFVFITGYGLYESYINKGKSYIYYIPLKRILPSVICYYIVAIIYIFYDFIFNHEHVLRDYIGTFTYGCTIISFGWYFQLSLLFYLIFYLIFRFVKKEKLKSLLLLLFLIGYFCFYYINNMSVTLYVPIFSFAYGILCSKYKYIIDKFINRFHVLLFIFSFLGFGFGSFFIWHYGKIISNILYVFISLISQFSLVVLVIIVSRFILKYVSWILINPLIKFIGSISMELYLLQGLVVRTLVCLNLNIYVFVLLTLVVCILISIPFNKLFGLIRKKIISK